MPNVSKIAKDVHGQSWIIGPTHQPIPLDTSMLETPAAFRRTRAEKFGPRYVAHRLDKDIWKECYTLQEVRTLCKGSVAVVRDRRAARGKWMYRLLNDRGDATDLHIREDPRKP
jgi:hypothetical protein